MELQRAKGVRDFGPEEKIVRERIVETLKKRFELSGFSPIETPIIERFDVLSSKYAGGEEILKETFKFKDQGDRDLCLRYDLTVPMCRFVGMNPNLKMPFKRYQIERVFRDGPMKLGRYREFWQCDIDIVGASSMLAETQLIEIAELVFKDLNLDVDIKINNRKILNGIMIDAGIDISMASTVILSIDKLEKMGESYVKNELNDKGLDNSSIEKVFTYFSAKNVDDLNLDNEEGKEGIKEIRELFTYLDSLEIKNARFDVTLARGLSYYTGTVFEVFLKNSEIKSATAGGGRYDNMIGNFLGGKQKYPAVGISFGLEVLSDALTKNADKKTVTEIFVIPINTTDECLKIVRKLREKLISTDLDLLGRGISKNLQYANSMNIPYCIVVGEDEIKEGKVKLKNMKTGEEKLFSIEEINRGIITQ